MFRYHHPARRFGARRSASASAAANADVRFFFAAYLAGTAFSLAYLF